MSYSKGIYLKGNKIAYQTNEEIGIICSNCDDIFTISPECLEYVQTKTWLKANNNYIKTYYNNKDLSLHRYLLKKELDKPENKDMVVDHIDRNPLNNRLDNLRIVSSRKNSVNSNKVINSKTGLIGVYQRDKSNNYNAGVNIGTGITCKHIYLGTYINKYDAALVHDRFIYLYLSETDYTATNIYNGYIPQEELYKRDIKDLSDINFIASKKNGNNHYKGVVKHNKTNTWVAQIINKDGKHERVGVSTSEIKAAAAREEYFLNNPEMQYINEYNTSNILWPEETDGKINIAGILFTKDEMEEKTRGY